MIVVILLGMIAFGRLSFLPQFSPFGLASNDEIMAYKCAQNEFDSDTTSKGSIYILENMQGWKSFESFELLESIRLKFEKTLKTNVHSITNLTTPYKGLLGYSQRSVLDLKSKEKYKKSVLKLDKMAFVKSKFLSQNSKYTLLFIDEVQEINKERDRRITKAFGNNVSGFHYSSSNNKKAETKSLISESIIIGLVALLLVLLGFYFLTKSMKGLLLIGLVILFNLSVTFTFMFMFGIPFSMNMIAIPCLLIILSFSDLMHIFHFQSVNAKDCESSEELRKNMISKIGFPMILTSVSNLIGFVVYLFLSDNEMLSELAIVSIVGVVVAYLSSRYLVIPLIDTKTTYIQLAENAVLNRLNFKIGNWRQSKKRVLIIVTVLLFIVPAIFLISRFEVNLKVENYISSNSKNHRAGEILTKQFFGSKSGEILIKTKDAKTKWTYAHQLAVQKIEKEIQEIFEPMHLTSSNSLIKRYNQISIQGNPNAYRLVKNVDAEVISQFVQELGGREIVSKDGKLSRVKWGFQDKGIPENLAKFDKLQKTLSANSDLSLDYEITGKSLMADSSVRHYSRRIIWGFLIAVLFSSIIILIYLKSVRLSIGTFLVNAIPLVIGLLLMLNSNVQINPQSLFLLGILGGLCLDDSIYLMGYRSKKINDLVLFPISVTSIVLALAFISLIFSSYPWLQNFAVIFIIGLALAFVLDVFVYPLFMNFTKKQDDQ